MRKIIRHPLFWVILASILPVLSLLHPGMPYLHDGQDHVARIANFYAALKDGIIVPRWAANLNWGYGHPILMFLYPLPEYLASTFHFLGFTLVDSTKLVFGLSFIASAVTMYLWMNAAFGMQAGIIGSLLYTFAPYRFVDLHVRGALGEHVAFIFPPLILYFLHKRNYVGYTCTLAALILSHNAMALMFIPIIGLYGLYLLLFEVKKKLSFILYGILFTSLGFGISAFFWIPAVLEGRFTLRDIVTAGEAFKRFVPWTWFIYSPFLRGAGQEVSKSIGFSQWLGILASVYMCIRVKDKKIFIFMTGLIILLAFSLFIMTSWSAPIWRASHILQNFQFPWRFLSVAVFVAAVLGGIAFARTKKLFLIFYSLLIILITIPMWFPKSYQNHDDSFYSGVYPGTTDTGESSPIWSVRFMERAATAHLVLIDGNASVQEGIRKTAVHDYTVQAATSSLMLENTLYFPGWNVLVDNAATDIQFQNPNYRGLMTFNIAPGTHTVRVVFEDTKVRKTATMISAVSIALLTCIWLKRKYYR